jgi:TonB family protein
MRVRARWIVAIGWSWLGLAGVAFAAPASAPSPVVQHYQAYRAAFEQGDLALAESEAARALAASVEQNGDAPPTAALALNLARLRLIRNQHSTAIEPARQALAIAEQHGDASGVDVHVARLVLGRAELPGGDVTAMERLLQAVRAAQGAPGMDDDAYPAAVELAIAAHDAGRYPLAREAWLASARFAKGSSINADYARARAKLGEATARIALFATVPVAPGRAPVREFEAADALLAEAMDLVHDQAVQSAAGGELTRAQALFGEAAALKAALSAKLHSDERDRWIKTEPKKRALEIGVTDPSLPQCERRLIARPEPDYPPAKRVKNGVGAVVMKALMDESGAVTRVQVAGAAGGQEFTDAVTAAARQWRVEKDDDSVAGCQMAREVFLIVAFRFSRD